MKTSSWLVIIGLLSFTLPVFGQGEKEVVTTSYKLATKGASSFGEVVQTGQKVGAVSGSLEQQLATQIDRTVANAQSAEQKIGVVPATVSSVEPLPKQVTGASVSAPVSVNRVAVQNGFQVQRNVSSAPLPPAAVRKKMLLRRQAQQEIAKRQAGQKTSQEAVLPAKQTRESAAPPSAAPVKREELSEADRFDVFDYFRQMGRGEIPEVGTNLKGDPYEREKVLDFNRQLTGTEAPGKNDKMSKDWWERQLLMSGSPLPYNWNELSYDQAVRFVQDVLQSKAAASQKSLFDIEKEAAQANLAPNRAPLTKEELRRKAQVIEAQSILADDFLGRSVNLEVENWARSKPDFIEDNWIWGDYEEPWNENVSSLRILMVNDIANFFNKFKQAAQTDSRVTLTTANNAQEAIDKLAANPTGYDIVMTDYHMPNKVGTSISMYVKQNGLTMPVVVLAQANGMPSWWFKFGMSGRIDINHTAEEVFNFASNIVATGKAFPNR